MAKDTREIITAAFLKLARQNPSATSFNMTEIASEAKISRQAIYQKHFSKVEEIIDYIHKKTDDQIFNAYSEYSPEKDHCPFEFLADKIFPIIYENRLTIGTLYMTKADPVWHDFLCENYSK